MASAFVFAAVSPVIPAVLPVVLWPDCMPVDCAGCDCCAVVLPVEGFVVWVAGEPEDCFAGAGADCFGLLGLVAGGGRRRLLLLGVLLLVVRAVAVERGLLR